MYKEGAVMNVMCVCTACILTSPDSMTPCAGVRHTCKQDSCVISGRNQCLAWLGQLGRAAEGAPLDESC